MEQAWRMISLSLPQSEDPPVDFILHGNTIVVGCTSGQVHAYRYDSDFSFTLLWSAQPHKRGLRQLIWHKVGISILSASVSGQLVLIDASTGSLQKLAKVVDPRDEKAINISRICLLENNGESLQVAIGDDVGNAYVIQIQGKEQKILHMWEDHDDFISGLMHVPRKKTLLASSGDGTLTVMDLKKGKLLAHTETFEDEVTCMISSGPSDCKAIWCATSQGAINIFGWGYWGAVQDRHKPKLFGKSAINSMCHLSNQKGLVMGCEDGKLRILERKGAISTLVIGQLPDAVEVVKSENSIVFAICTAEPSLYAFIPYNSAQDSDSIDGSSCSDSDADSETNKRPPKKISTPMNDFLKDLD